MTRENTSKPVLHINKKYLQTVRSAADMFNLKYDMHINICNEEIVEFQFCRIPDSTLIKFLKNIPLDAYAYRAIIGAVNTIDGNAH
jgi:hypothetical protein